MRRLAALTLLLLATSCSAGDEAINQASVDINAAAATAEGTVEAYANQSRAEAERRRAAEEAKALTQSNVVNATVPPD
jgi:hypothetical protein